MTPFDGIFGQDAALAVLRRALTDDRLPTAYLFHGPSGVGKEKTALALATEGVGKDEATAARVASGNHPDVRVFRPRTEGGRNLKVEQIREEVLPFTQFAPFEATRAFIVFPEADVSFPEHQAEAANALLKTLEEPRPNVHFILCAERPNRLLPTIRSRCQMLRFAPLPRDLIVRIARERGIVGDLDVAAALSGGSADKALALCASGAVDALFDTCREVDDLVARPKVGPLVLLAERLAKLEPAARRLTLDALCVFYRDVAVAGLDTAAPRWFAFQRDVVDAAAKRVSPHAAAQREAEIRRVADSFERNVNPQIALDALLHTLARLR